MKAWLAMLALAASPGLARAETKEYFVSKGVKYHIGDSRFNLSTDAETLGTFPVVGRQWIQRFTVDRPDTVRVRIDGVWGVDDCPYCLVLVTIDRHDMGRLTEENNHTPFTTLRPLAYAVRPGITYSLKIESFASQSSKADDFVISDVVVETEVAEVTFLPGPIIKDPESPSPQPRPRPQPEGTCVGSNKVPGWLTAYFTSRGMMPLNSAGSFEEQALSASLAANDYVEFYLRVPSVEPGDLVGQALEFLLGGKEGSGWILSFAPGSKSLLHANMRLAGTYRAGSFDAEFKAGDWNLIRVARCPDGRGSLFINGAEVGRVLENLLPQEVVFVRVKSLNAEFSDRPY